MRLVILFALIAACGAGSSTTDCATLQDTWANYGSTFFSSNCRTCHQHTNQYGSQAAVLASEAQISSEISRREDARRHFAHGRREDARAGLAGVRSPVTA